ncbi:MAG: hypothetical protein GF364_10240 [Candidatus Lokiarchaeota archaeon]|nr:hypothetical protein [Candidatus Lokiarchaeota archaeon]
MAEEFSNFLNNFREAPLKEQIDTLAETMEKLMAIVLRVPEMMDSSISQVNNRISRLEAKINKLEKSTPKISETDIKRALRQPLNDIKEELRQSVNDERFILTNIKKDLSHFQKLSDNLSQYEHSNKQTELFMKNRMKELKEMSVKYYLGKKCRNCDAINPLLSKFCLNCGLELDSDE